MNEEAEENSAKTIQSNSSSIFTIPNLGGSALYNTFSIDMNLFKMYEKLKHRKDHSYGISKVSHSGQELI
jgi:hypothetical protein